MKSKRVILAAFLVFALLFTACSNQNGSSVPEKTSDLTTENSNEPSDASDSNNSVLKDGVMTELTIVMPGGNSSPASLSEVEAAMNEIMKDTIDATIKFQILEWGVFGDQTNLMLSGGENKSLVFTWSSSKNYANSRQVQPITDIIKEFAPETYELFEKYLGACEIGGELYGLPTFHEYASAAGLVCRADVLSEINVSPDDINTWSDVENVLIKVREKYPDMNLLIPAEMNKGSLQYYNTGVFDILVSQLGVGAYADGSADEIVNIYASDEYKEMATTAYDWNEKGYFISDATTITDTRQELLSAGNSFGYIGKIHPGTKTQEIRNAGQDIETIIITDSICATADVNFAQYMVPTACDTPEKAVAFLNLLYTNSDMQNLMMYGIEGKDYIVKDAEKNIVGYPDGIDETTVGWSNEPWLSGNASISSVWETDPDTIWEDYLEFNDSAVLSPLYGFSFDTSNVKSEVTAISNVITKYDAVISSGYSEVESSITTFNDELESAGIQKIIDEAKSQISNWKSTQ